ncbi:MAG: hypothetical protein J7M34_06735 [Anaerolineae bacterium]|nr:hypothetical protein [Anaerolineae bacterium]
MIDVAGRVRAMRAMLWLFRGSVLLYAIIGFLAYKVIGMRGVVFFSRPTHILVLILVGLAAAGILGVFTFLIPARLADPDRLARRPGVNRLSAVVVQLQRSFMIAISGAHLVALLGLILFVLDGQLPYLFALTLVALLALATVTPQQARWEEIIQAVRARRSDWNDVW